MLLALLAPNIDHVTQQAGATMGIFDIFRKKPPNACSCRRHNGIAGQ